jgi:UDPglucose 6-dehydrogenase
VRVREGWALDNRVERMHTAVFTDNRGFSGKCYPKDLNGIVRVAQQVGSPLTLMEAVLRKNVNYRGDENTSNR